jgi:undecaprenyl pyrophosphate phosphatase UppP
MLTILQSLILGILQGLTEFMPISSSAHLVIVPWLFSWTDAALTSLPFDVALHLAYSSRAKSRRGSTPPTHPSSRPP